MTHRAARPSVCCVIMSSVYILYNIYIVYIIVYIYFDYTFLTQSNESSVKNFCCCCGGLYYIYI